MAAGLITAGILVGGKIIGDKIAANASKKAAETQAKSTDKALDVNERQYDQTRADLERTYQQQRADETPYLGLGAGAVGALTHGLGITPPPVSALPPAQRVTSPGAPVPTAAPPAAPKQGIPGIPGSGTLIPGSGALHNAVKGVFGFGGGGSQPTPAGAPAGAPSGVQMRAPNGQVQAVPPDQVAHYQQLGAQVV